MNAELITEWDSGQEVGGANGGTENRSNRVKWEGGYLMLLRWNVWKWLKDRGSNMFVLTCGAINPSRRFSNIMKPGVSPSISTILPPLYFDLVSLSSYSVLLTWTSFTWTSSGLWLVFMSGLLFGLHPHPSAHNCTTSTSDVLIWGHWYCILGSTVMWPHLRQSDLAAPSGGIKDIILFQKINHSWWTCKMFPFSVTLTPDYSTCSVCVVVSWDPRPTWLTGLQIPLASSVVKRGSEIAFEDVCSIWLQKLSSSWHHCWSWSPRDLNVCSRSSTLTCDRPCGDGRPEEMGGRSGGKEGDTKHRVKRRLRALFKLLQSNQRKMEMWSCVSVRTKIPE